MSNNKQSEDVLVNINEASKITNYSVSALYQKTSKNEIPYIKRTGEKRLWFNKEELLNYCKKPSQKKKNKARNEISIREVLTDAQLQWVGRVILEYWKTSKFSKPYFFPNVDSAQIKQNQTIKTYTEEQVLKMLEVCRDTDLYEHILTFEDILKTETPTEVPSEFFEARNFGNDTEDVFKGD